MPGRRPRDESQAAWNEVEVAADDRTITLGAITASDAGSDPGSWWAFSSVEFVELPEAVRVMLFLVRRRKGDPEAMVEGDPGRRVEAVLPSPLRGRVLVDGTAWLSTPDPQARDAEPRPWHRVRRADARTLVVYWRGGPSSPLSHVTTRWEDRTVVVTLWRGQHGGRLSGSYEATIVRLDRDIGDRAVVDGSLRHV